MKIVIKFYDIALSAEILIIEPLPNSFLSLRDVPGFCFSIHSASRILRGNTLLSLPMTLAVYCWWIPSWLSLSCLPNGLLELLALCPARCEAILQCEDVIDIPI